MLEDGGVGGCCSPAFPLPLFGGDTSLFARREVLILKEPSDALVPWIHEQRLVGLCPKTSPGPGVLQGMGDAAAGACF